MLIGLDKSRCTRCGVCVGRMKGYCIASDDGYPLFDAAVCNTCQKCVAICPSGAITVNGRHPDRIVKENGLDPALLIRMLEKRRSIKSFRNEPVSREILMKIADAAKYAPNQNKNISMAVIDDRPLLDLIDAHAAKFVRRMHGLLFGMRWVTGLIRLFYRDIDTIRRKMEHAGFERVLYENTQALIVATGDKRIPVTEHSGHYVLATVMYMAEALGVGNCLMDSVSLALRTDAGLRKALAIREDVLGVLALGYSNENIVNIPRGYEVRISFNADSQSRP